MFIKLISIGKTSFDFLKEGEKIYENRLKNYCKIQEIIIPNIKIAKNLSKTEILNKEGSKMLSKIKKQDYVILLDVKGNSMNSVEFSRFIDHKMVNSYDSLVFLICGAFGCSNSIYLRANERISLSKMTFSHQMVRLIFKEQLYRAFTIIKNEKYHH